MKIDITGKIISVHLSPINKFSVSDVLYNWSVLPFVKSTRNT